MNLSIVVPAYNEERSISRTIHQMVSYCRDNCGDWEIIVVDDGSSDNTGRIVEGIEGVRCLRNEQNQGKGFSVRRGMLDALYDPVLFTDADLSAPIEEARHLFGAIADGADIAIASRRFDVTKHVVRTPIRKLMAAVFKALVKITVIRGIHDTQCGFKMFRREAAHKIFPIQKLSGWGFDVELLFLARKKKLRIDEVPVSWQEAEESRLTWRTPLSMICDLLKIRANSLLGRYR